MIGVVEIKMFQFLIEGFPALLRESVQVAIFPEVVSHVSCPKHVDVVGDGSVGTKLHPGGHESL